MAWSKHLGSEIFLYAFLCRNKINLEWVFICIKSILVSRTDSMESPCPTSARRKQWGRAILTSSWNLLATWPCGSNFTDFAWNILALFAGGFSSSALLPVSQGYSVFSLTQNQCLERGKNRLEDSVSIKWKKMELS